jgi:hypothetical protein
MKKQLIDSYEVEKVSKPGKNVNRRRCMINNGGFAQALATCAFIASLNIAAAKRDFQVHFQVSAAEAY